ncbi:ABC transporter substrate-binding protein [Sphingobacterium deserti]|uniref:Periplasmic binding protein n=1 Tax=Sphingobacterium deserti TaxID=1229276 RepID=A0A0B8T2Y1_9SPHI|nr:ABC transporter substrate-binding protein [Sphingobacterium deserti]KGE15747.1 periplasmic binding protein [Sphingobacterium deserti]
MKKRMNVAVVLLIAAIAVVAASCTDPAAQRAKTSGMVSVVDASGEQIALDKPAERIVCLYEPALDAIYMLHAEDKIVGVFNDVYVSEELFPYYGSMDNRILEKRLPSFGMGNTANLEQIIAAKPDLVVAYAAHEDLINALRQAGLTVYAVKAELYDDVFKTVQDMATLTGTGERGAELVSFVKQEIVKMQERVDSNQTKRRVYFAWAYGRVFSTTGTNSMMHTCLTMAGVENVCPFDVDQPNISAETLIHWNPDMIVMWNDSPTIFYEKKEFAGIRAIQDRQIFNLRPMFLYNPHTLKALCTAAAINHWAYPNTEMDLQPLITNVLTKLYGKEKADRLAEQW